MVKKCMQKVTEIYAKKGNVASLISLTSLESGEIIISSERKLDFMELTQKHKKSLIKSTTDYAVNKDTGEVHITSHKEESIYHDGEDAYIKLYYSVVLATEGVFNDNVSVKFLTAVAPYISWAGGIDPTESEVIDDNQPIGQILQLTSYTRNIVAKKLGITPRRVFQILNQLCDKGLLKKIAVGVYWVNPFLVGKGKWKDVKTVRMAWTSSDHQKKVEFLDADNQPLQIVNENNNRLETEYQTTLFGEEIPLKSKLSKD